jgi:hypothetical protein
MRNNKVRLAAILAVMAIILIVVAPGAAAEKTVFECTDTFIETLNPGTWTYPDGNVHLRGMVNVSRAGAPDPRGIGYLTVVINANWDENYTGPMWGTFSLETDEGGLWEGTWQGMATMEGSYYLAVGNGFGLYDGMKTWVDSGYGVCQQTVRD